MNLLFALLRLLHIVAAVMWVGLAAAMALYVFPSAAAAGESGLRYMKSLYTKTNMAMAFPIASGVTVLAGIILYIIGGGKFSTLGQIVLGIGALAGIAAAIHGGAVLGRETKTFSETLAQYPDNQPIPADGLTTLREQAVKLGSSSRISLLLSVIALIGMGIARYL